MQPTGVQNYTSLLSLRVPIHWDETIWEILVPLPIPIEKERVVGDCA